MSIPIGNHGLFCIDDDDYAAYALAMQCNAEATDAALETTVSELNDYLDRPWIQVTNLNTITVDDSTGGGTQGPNGLVGALMRPSTTSGFAVTANRLPTSYSISDPTTLWPDGVYLVGANINWTLGALTASSIRQLMVYGVRDIGGSVSSTTNYTDLYQAVDYQGDGGASGALSISGLVSSPGDLAFVETFFTHANVASDLSVAPGQWRLWATYLGSGLAV